MTLNWKHYEISLIVFENLCLQRQSVLRTQLCPTWHLWNMDKQRPHITPILFSQPRARAHLFDYILACNISVFFIPRQWIIPLIEITELHHETLLARLLDRLQARSSLRAKGRHGAAHARTRARVTKRRQLGVALTCHFFPLRDPVCGRTGTRGSRISADAG